MIIPPKLRPGDEIRVVALARSLSLIGEENTRLVHSSLEARGFRVSCGKHCWEMGDSHSSSVDSRIEDFGHTNPLITFPIGGSVEIRADGEGVGMRIVSH